MTGVKRRRSLLTGGIAAGVALVLTACSSSGSGAGSATTAPSATTAAARSQLVADWKAPKCDRAVAPAPEVKAVAKSESDHDLTSFDGTRIRIHWFPRQAASSAKSPTVLMGPGWGQPGDVNTDPQAKAGIQSMATIAGLRKAGYNVATWDPRGFGESDGTVSIDSADFEAKDVSKLIDWVATQQGVQLDAPGNPRLGMVGASYGGGIQFVTAATDCRVDVITPTIAWNSLATSLYPVDTFKAGWAGLLMKVATAADLDPHVGSANDDALATGVLSQDDREWFVDRGPDYLLSKIHIPTLIIQGTVDNLFPLSEGIRNYRALSANGIPVAMTWFCGGHGICNNPADPSSYVSDAITNWLARYLAGDTKAPLVAGFQTTDQNGDVHTFTGFPPAQATTPVFAFADTGKLALQPEGGAGPLTKAPDGDLIGSLAMAITPGKADKALNVKVSPKSSERLLLGAPELALGYRCELDAPATRPTRIFAQLVDDTTGLVLGNQITPVPITCDGLLHQTQTLLEPISYAPGSTSTLTLQLVASTVAYAEPQMGGSVDFARIELSIPAVSK